MLPVLRHLLKQDRLTHAASARLQVACRALAQVHVSCVDEQLASAYFTDTAHTNKNGPRPRRITRTAASDADQLQLKNPGLQHDLRVPHAAWHPGTDARLSNTGGLGIRSLSASSAASDGSEPQRPMGTAAEARVSEIEGAAETPQPQQGDAADNLGDAAAPAGASTSSATTDADPQSQAPGEAAAAAAETQELDEMLQRMTAEAEDMILGGHPQEAIQHLTEVAEQLEGQLGADHFLSYRLWDQITQLHQEQGQHEESLNVASRALSALAAVPDVDAGPVAAMFRMRRGAALFAMGHISPALKDFAEAAEFLRGAFSPDFEAIGEARLYMALARVREAKDAEDVVRLEPRLREALKHMQQDKTERGAALREAGMRQHDRLIDAASAAGNWPLTLALYEQQAALLRSAGMKYKLLTHLYTYSTLLYVRNAAVEAEPLAQEGVALARQLLPSKDDEVVLRTLRLGTILLERGQFMEAADMVAQAAQRFGEVLKPDNPVRGEAAFALALARMFQLMPFQVAERRQLLEEMSAGLGVMAAGFGQEHQLVQKANVIWESARRMVEASKG